MKKDISIPEVADVYVAAVQEYNEDFRTDDWNVYLINDSHQELEMVLIVSKGFDKKTETSVMRHKMQLLPAKSFAKIEFLQEDVLKLNNEFRVSYFQNSQMFDKKFLFKKGSIRKNAEKKLPVIPNKGILAK
ncbi:MAG: hypothetical protein ABGW91_12640 [Christiangramia sp.]|uniref:hypothetical protein n=1 Tax=Christiangramia sp. TaxID=1931228 RepID=UPI000C611DD6|nr:hypothetical protein [Christiangramia sp.]